MAKEVAAVWFLPSDTIPASLKKVAGVVYADGVAGPDNYKRLLSRSYAQAAVIPDGLKKYAALRYNIGDVIPDQLEKLALAPPSLYVGDTYTRGDSATSPGVCESGQAYSSLGGTWGIASGKLYRVDSTGDGVLVADSKLADCTIDIDNLTENDGLDGVAFRCTDISNYYLFRVDDGAANCQIYKVVSGVATQLVSISFTAVAGTTYHIQIILLGSSIKVLVNGVQKHSIVDTTFVTQTLHGVRILAAANAGIRFDNFTVHA